MTKPITPEMVAAWQTLQDFARHAEPNSPVKKAIDVLDDSDYMVSIEEVGNELETAAQFAPAALDPAEWGDTTRDDMDRHQREAAILAAGGEVHLASIPLSELTGEGLSKAIRRGKSER